MPVFLAQVTATHRKLPLYSLGNDDFQLKVEQSWHATGRSVTQLESSSNPRIGNVCSLIAALYTVSSEFLLLSCFSKLSVDIGFGVFLNTQTDIYIRP